MVSASRLPAKCIICGARYSHIMGVRGHFIFRKRRGDGRHIGPWDNSIAELIINEHQTNPINQLRSSRLTRNADHSAQRNRPGVHDWDPTDGLPVRKYVLETVKINQDADIDPTDAADKAAAEKDDFPWPEQPLPSFFNDLQPHTQALLRRARQGDRDAKPSVWDRKTQEWVPAAKAKSRGLGVDVLKSRHLMNVDLEAGQDDADDDDEEEGSGDEDFGMTGFTTNGPTKKRKLATGPEERIIEVKKWVQVPMDKADKMVEPKYLADRRPGMGSIYTPAYLKSVTAYGAGIEAVGTQAAAFDLGDGGGLGNALGGNAVAASGEATPVRKNMPPKRKKKKLGGPGRRKAVPVEAVAAAGEAADGEVKDGESAVKAADGEEGVKKEGEDEGDEGSGDESEGEGSEEGEVNEDVAAPAVVESAPASVPLPVVNIEEVKEAVEEVKQIEEEVAYAPAAPADDAVEEKGTEPVEEVKIDLLGSVEAALEQAE